MNRNSYIMGNMQSTNSDITDLSTWLREELDKRGWSIREIARRAGLVHGTVVGILNGRHPGIETCRGIARALGVPTEEVLRRAGLLPPLPPRDEYIIELEHLARHLNTFDRRAAVDYLRYLHRRETPYYLTAGEDENPLTGQILSELNDVSDDFRRAVLKTIKTWKILYEELK